MKFLNIIIATADIKLKEVESNYCEEKIIFYNNWLNY